MLNSVNSRLDSLDSHSSNSASESNTYEAAKSFRVMDFYQQPLDLSLKRSSTNSLSNKTCSKKMRNSSDVIRNNNSNEACIANNTSEANHLLNSGNREQPFNLFKIDSYINLNRIAQNFPGFNLNEKQNQLANLLSQPTRTKFVKDYNFNNQASLNNVTFKHKESSKDVKNKEKQKNTSNKRLKRNTQRKERKSSLEFNTVLNEQILKSYNTSDKKQAKQLNQYKMFTDDHSSNSQAYSNIAMRFTPKDSNSTVPTSINRNHQAVSDFYSFYNQTSCASSNNYPREVQLNNLPAKKTNLDLTKKKAIGRFQNKDSISGVIKEADQPMTSNYSTLYHIAAKQNFTHSGDNNYQPVPHLLYNTNIPQTSVLRTEFLEAALKQNSIPNEVNLNMPQALKNIEPSIPKNQTSFFKNNNQNKKNLSSYPKVKKNKEP